MAEAGDEEGAVAGEELARVGVVVFGGGFLLVGLEESGGEERGDGDGEEPGETRLRGLQVSFRICFQGLMRFSFEKKILEHYIRSHFL